MIQSLNKPKDDVRVESSVQKAKEKKLYTLRVTNTTVILVPLHKRNEEYAEHMGKDIQALLECDAVMFLQGWHDSKGCLAEFEVAKIYGKKLIFE